MIRLTRRYRFSASHRLDSTDLSPAENRAMYGKCNNPFGHGHDYKVEISVSGDADPETGRVIDPGALDALVNSEVLVGFGSAHLNDLRDFERMVATTENLAVAIERRLAARWPAGWPRLDRIRIEETRRNHFELRR
ncbi:MAG TPA: 6-carboxytetrahydropterin synthase [Bryobacteraceae bacterium]|nr:6-carboxytetrahydropterin synthase [Bryobacteraceae bacterium]